MSVHSEECRDCKRLIRQITSLESREQKLVEITNTLIRSLDLSTDTLGVLNCMTDVRRNIDVMEKTRQVLSELGVEL